MKKLIIHLGPGKCGSSSIQSFFLTKENPCIEKTKFLLLNPNEIMKYKPMAKADYENSLYFKKIIDEHHRSCDVLILSHEVLFNFPLAIQTICSISKRLTDSISIIGYSRRQSDFLVSAYSQWFFRWPIFVNQSNQEMKKMGLESILFTGLEKQLIASILMGFKNSYPLLDEGCIGWINSYQLIEKLCFPFGAKVECGTLPTKKTSKPLIHDFCDKAGITIKEKIKQEPNIRVNSSFNHQLVEATHSALTYGLNIPSIHHDNEYLQLISNEMSPSKKTSSTFVSSLKNYIDNYFLPLNLQLCDKFNISSEYFISTINTSKKEIIAIIQTENEIRSKNKSDIIENNRKITASVMEACLKLARNQKK